MNIWLEIKLAFALLKREGGREFVYRFWWYLRGKKLKEEIPGIIQHEKKIYKALIPDSMQKKLRHYKRIFQLSDVQALPQPQKVPLVSVVIPAYNHEKYIQSALDSVANQTYQNLEIIVINDGSKDQTSALAHHWGTKYKRPIRIFDQENQGAHYTINKGLDLAHGKYVTILNSDDYYHPHRLEYLVKILEDRQLDFGFTKITCVNDHNEIIGSEDLTVRAFIFQQEQINKFPSIGFALLNYNVAISTGNMIFTKKLYKKIGYFKEYKYCHDWDFILRALAYTEPAYIDIPLYHYRLHDTNTFLCLQDVGLNEINKILSDFFTTQKTLDNPYYPDKKHWGKYYNHFIKTRNYEKFRSLESGKKVDRKR